MGAAEAITDRPVILFAAGRGGDPVRHDALLARLERHGFAVVAPKFAMIESNHPTRDDLQARLDIVAAALAEIPDGVSVTGVGHSIGATLLMALAGAQIWLMDGQPLTVARCPAIARLVLMAPPVGFFGAPRALDGINLPLMFRVGSRDQIAPSGHLNMLADRLSERMPIDYALVEDADHFTFMDKRPPNQPETMSDANGFRTALANAIANFATA